MSDSEDFLLQISPDLFPVKTRSAKLRKGKIKRRNKKMKFKKLMPNHFIAFKIYDSVIRQNIAEVHKRIIDKNPLLNKALIDLRTLHVTLAVTHLENEEKIFQLREKLQDWCVNNMKSHFNEPIRLTFKGIGTFRKDVAFVKINECENYKRLCLLSTAFNNLLNDSGFYSESKRDFMPHLTLLKLSKNRKLFMDNKKEVSSVIENLSECNDEFGSQDVSDIQLLSMNAKKDDNGYYKCLWEVKTKEEPAQEE